MTDLEVEISLARPDELNDIWDLYRRTYLETYVNDEAGITKEKLENFLATDSDYFPKNWQQYLEQPSKKRTIFVARHNDKVVGMVAPVFVEGRHRITGLYVSHEVQHMGIGTRLVERALAHLGNVDVYAGIASHVKELQNFYEHFGFRAAEPGKFKEYPPDPMLYIDLTRPATKSSE